MRLLLDTNSMLWFAFEDRRLGKKAQALLATEAAIYVSSISIFEVTIKKMLGKLDVPDNLSRLLQDKGFELLDFSTPQAETVKNFPRLIRHDPFDRMLLAQAKTERLSLLTADTILLSLGMDFVLDARI